MNKDIEKRINRVIGQLESLKTELDGEYDCEYAVQQIKTIMGAVKSLGYAIAEDDLAKCIDKNLSKKEQSEHYKKVLEVAFK